MSEHDDRAAARFLAALAEPTRLRIVRHLAGGPSNVTKIAVDIGVEIVNVSHHLNLLKSAGVVASEKDGRFVVYSLACRPADNTIGTKLCMSGVSVTL